MGVRPAEIEQALERAEDAVARGAGLGGTGFWKAVAFVRSNRAAAERHADRIGVIDRRAFEQGVRLRVPGPVGTALLAAASAGGAAAVVASPRLQRPLLRTSIFLGGFGALEVGTHSLAHWAVGRLMGMRFSHYFVGGPPPPRPGAKLDYASYLVVPPARRAAMHASGAVVTKLIPFALIPAARRAEVSSWGLGLLVAAGVGQLMTDALISTKSSDWKKVRRELRAAKSWAGGS